MAYFRIYLTSDNQVAIIQLGESDEIDYNQNRFLSSSRFESEEEAVEYLQENTNKLPGSIHNPYSQKYKGLLD